MTPDHADCRDLIWLNLPYDATITEDTPLPASPWQDAVECPHDVTFWVAPTDAQAAVWAQEQTP